MQTINEMYEQSLLTMAAYAEFKVGVSLSKALEDADFSKSQASQFLAKYEYLDKSDDTTTGFSGTFFKVKTGENAGQIVFALRGTDFSLTNPVELIQDLISDISLGLNGVATSQVIDMMNYYLRAITPADEEVPQYTVELDGTVLASVI